MHICSGRRPPLHTDAVTGKALTASASTTRKNINSRDVNLIQIYYYNNDVKKYGNNNNSNTNGSVQGVSKDKNNTSNKKPSSSSSSKNKTTGKKDNTVAPTILPQTGLGRGIMAIVVIATVYGIYAYRKYNYLKDIK